MDILAERSKIDCWICFNSNEYNIRLSKENSEEILKNCVTYLDNSIIINSCENGTSVSCCNSCYNSVHQLTILEKQLEKLQKEISDLRLLFSRKVEERRNEFENQKGDVDLKQEVIEFDGSEGPEYFGITKRSTETKSEMQDSTNDKADEADDDIKTFPFRETIESDEKFETSLIPSSETNISQNILRGDRPYQCSICNKTFKTSSNLKYHAIIHGKRRYKCSLCSKRFFRKKDLNDHQRVHTGERPYRCSFCDKSLKSSTALKYHEIIHTREKCYKCSFCDDTFARKQSLTEHEKRVHSGEERPYKCSNCEKAYCRKPDLIKHERKHEFILP